METSTFTFILRWLKQSMLQDHLRPKMLHHRQPLVRRLQRLLRTQPDDFATGNFYSVDRRQVPNPRKDPPDRRALEIGDIQTHSRKVAGLEPHSHGHDATHCTGKGPE